MNTSTDVYKSWWRREPHLTDLRAKCTKSDFIAIEFWAKKTEVSISEFLRTAAKEKIARLESSERARRMALRKLQTRELEEVGAI